MKLAFIGIPGGGKSAAGKEVAQKLGLAFADIDNILVSRLGMTIAQAFITYGEPTFRAYETAILKEFVWQDNIVISCGGGAVLTKENVDLLKGYKKIRLLCDANVIYNRIKDDFSRPLIKDNSPKAIQQIIDARENAYSSCADITIDTTYLTIQQVVEKTLKLIY